jgi:hypothetical protein
LEGADCCVLCELIFATDAVNGNVYVMPKKPIDLWLVIGSLVVGIILYVLTRTPVAIIALLTLAFVLLIHPAWNFWWIEKALWRRILALCVIALALAGIGYSSWPISSQQIVEIKQPEIKTPPPSPAVTDSKPKPNKQAKPQPKVHLSKSQSPKPELPVTSAQKQETPPPIISAPHGIAIGGSGTVTNPTVNNFAPPEPVFSFSVVEIPTSPEDSTKYKMRVIIKTDRETAIPSFRVVFDGPYLNAYMSIYGRGSGSGANVMYFNGKRNGVEYPWAQFALAAPGKLRPDGEIHIDVEAENPIKLREISKL